LPDEYGFGTLITEICLPRKDFARLAKKEYYTSQEARQRLGVSKTTFYEYVKAGHIYKLPPQKQRGAFYLAKDVDELAAARKGFAKSDDRDKEKTIFRRARPEDAQQMHELGASIMRKRGEHSAPTKMLLHFLSMPNSEIGHVVVRDEQVIGYFTLVPLTHDQILHVMRRDQQSLFHSSRIYDVKPEDLAKFEPGKPIDVFIWEVISDPEQKAIGQYLINKILAFFHTLGRRGVDIQGIYATATTHEGKMLCQRIGMQIMEDLPEIIQPDWIPFEWKIQEKKTWLTKNYIQALRSYRKRQERMQKEADAPAVWSDEI